MKIRFGLVLTVATGFGLTAWVARDAITLNDALEAASAHHGPTLIDARIDSAGYLQQMKSLRG